MNRSNHSGFTLIELMAVLAVIAIMTALIIPEMRGTLSEAELRSSARTLINACQVASSRAIALNQPQELRIEAPAGRYQLRPLGNPGTTDVRTRAQAPVDGRIDSRVTFSWESATEAEGAPESQTPSPNAPNADERPAADARHRISFYPDGTAQGATMVLRDREGFRLALEIQPVTARVRVLERPRN